jgi:hypothetical protein
MAVKFNAGIDLGKSQLISPRAENLANNAKPSSPATGQFFYNSTDNRLEVWNGSNWIGADGSVLLTATAPGASAVADTAAAGSSASAARLDHRHARESFGNVTAETSYGGSSSNGAATTVARSDHGHGNPAHGGTEHSAVSISSLSTPTGAVAWGSQKITGLADGTAAGDAVNFGQLESARQARNTKAPAIAATTANLDLNGNETIDGVSITAGMRVLVKNQTTGTENGIYVAAAGAWARADDADPYTELQDGAEVWVQQGTTNGDKIFRQTATLTNFGGQNWVASAAAGSTYTAGDGLTESAGTFNVGEGAGIDVTADAVAIDTAVVVRKFAAALTGGSATEVVTHNLNTKDVTVTVYNNTGSFPEELFEIRHTSVNTITVVSDNTIPASTYRVVVHG